MIDLFITNMQGQMERLTGYKDLTRNRRVNAERTLSFLLIESDKNEHAFPLVEEESILELENQLYRIKRAVITTRGNKRIKTIEAESKFIGDLIDGFQYENLTGYLSIDEAMTHALQPTNYTYIVTGASGSSQFENFGQDNPLSLVNAVLERFSLEMEVDDDTREIRLEKQISRTTDAQFRYKHNLKAIEQEINTNNLSTYIKGYGKQNEDGTYQAAAEYTSPNADKFPADTPDGLRHAPAVYDERFTDSDSLREEIESRIIDEPEITFTVSLLQLREGGFEGVAREGDEVFVIHEPLEVDITARIMEIEDYPGTNKPPNITLSNYKENLAEQISDTSKQLKDIFNPYGEIKYDILERTAKAMLDDIKATRSEITYNDNGILAIDKTDPNNIMMLNSTGWVISTDGLNTTKTAATAEGIVADVITTGTMLADRVRGGLLLSQNGNTEFNMNTGKLSMASATFELGSGAEIGFLDTSNKLYYERYDDTDAITRTAGVGVTTSISNRHPVAYLGASETDKAGFGALDDNDFHGFIANTKDREDEDNIGSSVIGRIFHIRDKAIQFTQGFSVNLMDTTKEFYPMYTGNFNYNLGQSGNRFYNLYLKNNPDVSSDERLKEDITTNALGLNFINDLETKQFRLKQTAADENPNDIQYGIIAQQLVATLQNHGVNIDDISLVNRGEDDMYGVQYSQLITPLIKAVQELTQRVEVLENGTA